MYISAKQERNNADRFKTSNVIYCDEASIRF